MSSRAPTPALVRSLHERVRRIEAMSGIARLWRSMRTAVATACFWLAVVLPAAYVPLLGGSFRAGERYALLGLLVVHAVVLYAGHEVHGVPAGGDAADEP